MLPTPITYESLTFLRTKIKQNTALAPPNSHCIQRLADAVEKAFADRAILLDENKTLFDHDNEKTTRQSVRSTMVGKARIISHEAIVEAEQKQTAKAAIAAAKRGNGQAAKLDGGQKITCRRKGTWQA